MPRWRQEELFPLPHAEHVAQEPPLHDEHVDEPSMRDAALCMLNVCSEISSAWFKVMRSCIERERERQKRFRRDNKLPRKHKVAYEKPSMTEEERAMADMSESVVRALFGDSVAQYARARFQGALDTGDLRAFKIRLLVFKARDALSKTKLLSFFKEGMDQCISDAESKAGCIPDPSPRRMSRAEKALKRQRMERKASIMMARLRLRQMELPLIWEDTDHAKGVDESCSPKDAPHFEGSIQYLEESPKKNVEKKPLKKHSDVNIQKNSVTVTHFFREIVRKVRDYSSVDQILEDIDEGRIVAYESVDEICEDLRAGRITPMDGFMFVAALNTYSPDTAMEGIEEKDMEEDVGGEADEDFIQEEPEDIREGASFSYNPQGFCGGMDCRNEDEW